MDCLFCRIISGEIPSTRVYEDDAVVAFRDIDPQAPVHVVVVPREHVVSAADITPQNSQIIARVFEAVAVIARQEGLDEGFRVVTNSGAQGGQTVGHLHFHLLGKRNLSWPPG